MSKRHVLGATFITLATAPFALAQVGFDLVEINAAPGPQNPGVAFTFVPVETITTEAAGVSVADVNNDTFLDMLICGTEGKANEFYLNNGNGTFTESAALFGIDEPSKRRGNSIFFDFDNDGDLDLITCGYPGELTVNLDLYSLHRNDGPAGSYHFTDITASSGGFVLAPTVETTVIGVAGGAAVGDYNNDGFLDVIVTYWYRNNLLLGYDRDQFRLWKNVPNPARDMGQPDYTPRLLVDATIEAGLDGAAFGEVWMPSFIDFNRDGKLDLHINVETAADELRLNNGNGTFGPNIATSVGMNYNATGSLLWGNEMGIAFADYDNDGDIDTYHTNSTFGSAVPSKVDAFYRNDSDLKIGGLGLKFTHIGPVTGINTNVTTGIGWGAAFVDLDNDGDKELINARGLGSATAPNYIWNNLFPQLASDGKSTKLQLINTFCPQYSGVGGTLDTARSMVPFDFDNDGDLDVAYTRSQDVMPPMGANLKAGFFLNTLNNGKPSLQLDLKQRGGSLNTVGTRVFLRTGGTTGVVQMCEVKAGSSFLGQEPYRLHFGLGSATGADWLAIRWFDGSQQVVTPAGPPLAGFQSVTHAALDSTGDLDGDLDTDAADLALFVTAMNSKADVDLISPNWPWRQTADADGNGVLDSRDLAKLRALVPGTFASLGNGLAGTHGIPVLTGSGPLTGGSPVNLTLSSAKENANWWMITGFSVLAGNLKGGVLVPDVNVLIGPLPTTPAGSLPLNGTWPVGLPSNFQFFFQAWVQDPAGVKGFASTNALSALTP